MDIETLTKVADSLAEATGRAGDTAPEDGSEAQVEISLILTSLAERLGDEDGPAFLRMYARACEREDANPLVLDVSHLMPCDWHEEETTCEACPPTACEGHPLHEGAQPCEAFRVTCGGCDSAWCEKCDPGPSALCHTCHGRGYSTAPLD